MKIRSVMLILLALIAGVFSSSILATPLERSEDVGVSAILSPPDTVVLDYTYPLSSVIFNLGTQPSTFDVVIALKILGSSSLLATDTVTITNLPSGAIDTANFSPTFAVSAETTYQVTSYTILAGDENHANDTVTLNVRTLRGAAVWYGHVNVSPVSVHINSLEFIDAYVQTNDDVYVADIHLCLGGLDAYIDSFMSVASGQWYYPFTDWDVKRFYDPQGSPPNPIGWSSQSFQGFADIAPPYSSLWLHSVTPIRVLTYAVRTVNDSLVIGQTVQALGPGINAQQGGSNAGDSLGGPGFPVLEFFSPLFFLGAGNITGQVINEISQPIQGVEVIDLNTSTTAFTGSDGRYTLSNLYPGMHSVSFSHPNQRDTVVTDVNVRSNQTTTLNVRMQPLPFHDAAVTAILSPPQFVQLNTSYPLKSEVANLGTSASTFNVVFEAYALGGSTPLVADTFNVVNMPGSSIDTITFSRTLLTDLDTTYELISYSLLAEDIDASNDTSTATSSIFFGVSAWYGNLDMTPMAANVGDRFTVDVYIQTIEAIYLSYMHLCLGTANRYIDSLLSKTEGELFYPFTEWDIAQFTSPQDSPPNPDGWSSQSFIGYGSIGSVSNPWLHFETPTKALAFKVKIANDPLLIGDTIQCFGPGLHQTFGPSSASDTLLINTYPVIEVFSPLYFKNVGFIAGTVTDVLDQPIENVYVTAEGSGVSDSTDLNGEYFLDSLTVGIYDVHFNHPLYRDTTVTGVEVRYRETTIVDMILAYPCYYTPGDINGDGRVIGSDVTFGVNYFRSVGPHPPDSCFNANSGTWLYSAGDVNGDCLFINSDITYLVNYFRSINHVILFCPFTPPPTIIEDSALEVNKLPTVNPRKSISLDMEDKR